MKQLVMNWEFCQYFVYSKVSPHNPNLSRKLMTVTVAQKRNSKQSYIKDFFCISQSVSNDLLSSSKIFTIFALEFKYA